MSAPNVDVRGILERAGANPDAPEGSQAWALAQVDAAVAELVEAHKLALATIDDYLAYEHDGDPWKEDARAMGEMDINDFATDGRLGRCRSAIARIGGYA